MKKLTAVLLSLVLALSLAATAFAAPAPDAAPEDIIPISGILDDALWAGERAYLDAHPGLEERLRGSAYDYFAQEYPYYDSPEEYMEYWEMTEEEFLDEMVLEQTWDLIKAEGQQNKMDALKEALGGVPGQIGVMLNGEYVQFPDAAPEVTGGRTMVPVRPIVEALGGQAGMEDGKVICEADGVRLTFTPGVSEVLTEYTGGELPGDGQMFPMDCAPYIKEGRTYVPVRFLGEILGYEVGWDGAYQTAQLVNREAVAAKYDEKFTIMNRAQANQTFTLEEGKNYRADLSGGVTVTAFDTLHGDKTYKADLTGKALINTQAANGAYSVKLSDSTVEGLLELIEAGNYTALTEEEKAALRSTIHGLEELEFIVNRNGLMWVRAPLLDELMEEDNVWYGLDLGAELAQAMFGETEAATMGTVLAALIDVDSVESFPTVVSPMAQLLYELYGDDQFTTAGGVSTRTIGLEELAALYEGMGIYTGDVSDDFTEFELTVKVDQSGRVTMALCMETPWQYDAPAMRITMDTTQSGRNVRLTMDCHVSNVAKVNLTLNQTWNTTTEVPEDQPPEGSTVVDAGTTLNP